MLYKCCFYMRVLLYTTLFRSCVCFLFKSCVSLLGRFLQSSLLAVDGRRIALLLLLLLLDLRDQVVKAQAAHRHLNHLLGKTVDVRGQRLDAGRAAHEPKVHVRRNLAIPDRTRDG